MVLMISQDADFIKSAEVEINSIEIKVPDEWKKAYASAWDQRRERIYKIYYRGKTYYITCFVLRDKKKGEDVLFLPEFLIPRRPYPVYVYLFAISLYCENPGMGQRAVAEATRKKFGLETFSHTTVGRAIKAFVLKLETKNEWAGDTEETGKGKQEGDTERKRFPSKQTTETNRRRAMAALPKGLSGMGLRELIPTCCRMARERQKHDKRYLL